jgi:hypothetical protein
MNFNSWEVHHSIASLWMGLNLLNLVFKSQRHPFSRAHFKSSRWPLERQKCTYSNPSDIRSRESISRVQVDPRAAKVHVHESHSHPFSRAHFKRSMWPSRAVCTHVHESHLHLFSRAHFKRSRWPSRAAKSHTSLFLHKESLYSLKHLEVK